MSRAVFLFVLLFAIWLLWSQHFQPLMLAFGVGSCLFATLVSVRLRVLEVFPSPMWMLRALRFTPWLAWQIVVSNFHVAKVILSPSLPIAPRLVRVAASQPTALGQVTYANSITLTPGTVTLDLRNGTVLVHALTEQTARDLESGEMDRRVCAIEAGA